VDAPFSLEGARIGYWGEPPVGAVEREVAAIVDAAVESLAAAGAVIEPVALPGENLHELFQTFWFTGAAGRLAALDPERLYSVDPGLREIAAAGQRVTAVEMVLASQRRAEFGKDMDRLLARYAVLVSPAVAIPPFEVGLETPEGSGLTRWTEWAGFSFPINLSQQPACVIPCGKTAAGRPVGFQIIGARGQDARVLAAAAAMEGLIRS
jgi:amidase/aspartyl-tRNA(Asn)/glutamyl-tRNA(Gln) amidotransferase subunit A